MGASAVIAHSVYGGAGVDFYFDEMWRVDFIRAANPLQRMLTHDTPVPPGWVYLMKLGSPLGTALGPAGIRALSWIFTLGLSGLVFLTLTGVADRRPGVGVAKRQEDWTAAATAIALVMIPALTPHFGAFNNYPFEAFYLALAVWLCLGLEHRRSSWPAFLATVGLAPAFVFGPLLAMPALVARAALCACAGSRPWRRLGELAAACASATLLAIALYVFLYRHVTASGTIAAFWADQSLPRGLADLSARLADAAHGVVDLIFRPELANTIGWPTAALLVTVGAAVGCWELGRRWSWYLATVFTAQLLTVPAALSIGWAITPGRINLSFVAMFLAATLFGFFRLLEGVASRLPRGRTVVRMTAAVIVFALLLPPRISPSNAVFARGLTNDLEAIVGGAGSENLVLSYHFMSHFYTHDVLLNRDQGDRDFLVLRELRGDGALYEDIETLVAEHLPDGGRVWCVLPYALGPEQFGRACRTSSSRISRVWRYHGAQAEIVALDLR